MEQCVRRGMFSSPILQNVLRGGECSLVLSCGTFGEEGNVHWLFLSCGTFCQEGNVLWFCAVECAVRRGMFSASILRNVL